MAISGVMANGLVGIRNGMNITDRAGGEIANFASTLESSDLAKNMVDLRIGQRQVELSATVVKAGDEMLGTLIDIRA